MLAGHELIREPEFTRDVETVEVYWRVREGLHGLIGKMRPPGTALIVEDVCVPPERIAEGAADLQALLGEHGFLTGVAGHASAGNLHFMLTPDFAKREDLERYDAFMEGLIELVVDKYDGSLKAEHGTGVNMAPFVEREWGSRATELMWRVKRLADPDGVLAPGVVLNDDPGVHLRNLKTTPAIEDAATTCVECGFCEPVCPSRDLTTTPRQRIVLRREIARQRPGLAGRRGARRAVRLRRPRHLRRGRHLPARPARSGSTPASWSRSCAAGATPSARGGWRSASRVAGTRSRPPRGRGCARAARDRSGRPRFAGRALSRGGRSPRTWSRAGRRACRRRPRRSSRRRPARAQRPSTSRRA